MKKIYILISLLIFGANFNGYSQISKNLSFQGYADIYYSYNFNDSKYDKLPFLSNYNRHNSIVPNLIMAKAQYNSEFVRGNFGIHAGTYVEDNVSGEPISLRYISEANLGFKLSKSINLWLDAGILPSHIGWESNIGVECPTLTRSLAAAMTPTYETGLKLSYTSKNDKLNLGLLILNGWQTMLTPADTKLPSLGHQLTYTPNKYFSISSNSFFSLNNNKTLFAFHDLYAVINPIEKLSITLGFDTFVYNYLKVKRTEAACNFTCIAQYKINDKNAVALRGEYFYDSNMNVLSSPNNLLAKGNVFGVSFNYDRRIYNRIYWRNEIRSFFDPQKRFFDKDVCILKFTTSLAMYF